ncbi:MAG: aminoacyl--tRNA ligase-related protein [bacterium]|nr:aminoacyl--tRNA ligase-related protein [bacterium]
MRLSTLFTKSTKEAPKDELSFNARILIQAGFIDKLAPGVYTYLPFGLLVLKKIENIIREEMNIIGGQEVLMPALTPRQNWEITSRWDSFDALFKLKGFDSKEYALGATHEEVIVPMIRQHAFSYKDFPVYVYQIQTKFRNEKRAKSGLMRGREFIMKDLYSFHMDEDDLENYYQIAQKAYFKIFERCGLLDKTFLTYASGGAFSKFSHEFQTLAESGEDDIYVCRNCSIAINSEIINDMHHQCPNCKSKKLAKERAIEVGNIFKLKDRFTKPFSYVYIDESGKKQPVLMGCYGMGLTRILGTIAETCHDDNGLIWPKEVAPFTVHIVTLNSREAESNNKVKLTSEKIYKELKESKIDVLFDDRETVSTGEKFVEADLIGCPIRLVVSERTLAEDSVEIKKRDEKETELVGLDKVLKYSQ